MRSAIAALRNLSTALLKKKKKPQTAGLPFTGTATAVFFMVVMKKAVSERV